MSLFRWIPTLAFWRRKAVHLLALVALAAGLWATQWRLEVINREARERVLSQAIALARTIEPERVKSLLFTPEDRTSLVSRQLQEQLLAYRRTAGLGRICCLGLRDGKVALGPDTLSDGPQDSAVKSSSSTSSSSLSSCAKLFQQTQTVSEGPIRAGHKKFFRAFAPVQDPRNGTVLMVVGVELQAQTTLIGPKVQAMLPLIIALALVSLLLVGRALISWRARNEADAPGWLRHAEVVLTGACGALLTVAIACLLRDHQQAIQRDLFVQIAEGQAALLKAARTDIRNSLMVGMSKYLEDDRRILEEEFHYYVGSLVSDATVRAFQWVPCVSARECPDFEARARSAGFRDFFIFERNANGERVPVSGRDVYYPVYYSEPLAGNELSLGYDLGSEPVRRAALEKAERSGLPTATDPLRLAQEPSPQNSLLIYHPVHVREDLNSSNEELVAHPLVGFALAVVGCQSMLDRALSYSGSTTPVISLDWYLVKNSQAPSLLGSWPLNSNALSERLAGTVPEHLDRLAILRPFFAFGAAYALVIRASSAFVALHPARAAQVTCAVGLVLTSIATALVALMRGRQGGLEEEVRHRTESLRASEASLQQSLSLLQATLESTADGILVVDCEGRIRSYNERFVQLWSMPQEILALRDDQASLDYVLQQLKQPEEFTAKVRHLYDQPTADSFDVLEFKDGRVYERYSRPQFVNGAAVGRVWSFRDVTSRQQAQVELEAAHRQLVVASRRAGMAEVATSVLHNVGNVLNSVNVSASMLVRFLKQSKVARLCRATRMLKEHEQDLTTFVREDPKGRLLPGYLCQLATRLSEEQAGALEELQELINHVEHINRIVAMQQYHAKCVGVSETVSPADLVEDALKLNAHTLARNQVELSRDYETSVPALSIDKHKALQILVNLVRNAEQACVESGSKPRKLALRVAHCGRGVMIEVTDNGVGIPPENLTRVFSHGFTTRRNGHGFGLHSGALAAAELGGALHAHSQGLGRGATFVLELPLKPEV